MKTLWFAATAAVVALCASSPALADTVSDPVGDFLPSFTGPHTGDLDVTSFGVTYDPSNETFRIAGTLAAAIEPESDFYYVIGVNTGSGAIQPFASIGEPNVIFNQVVVVGGEGEAFLAGGDDLPFTIAGNMFSVSVPLSVLPSTGFSDPLDYGFNLWPRIDLTPSNLAAISDFAPENATLQASAVPEPATWLSLLMGFGFLGAVVRSQRAKVKACV